MYYSIRGNLLFSDQNRAVVESADGVAFECLISFSTFQSLPEVGSQVRLFTRLIVRENDMFLIGFLSLAERGLFDSLSGVSGIGPKVGLKILSDLSVHEIRSAIAHADSVTLSRVKGIGRKTAERIVLELKDKMKELPEGEMPELSPSGQSELEALMALRVLGYSDSEAKPVIKSLITQNLPVEEIIRQALAILSGGRNAH